MALGEPRPRSRTPLGLLALGCLIGAAGVLMWVPERTALAATLWRVGVVLGAMWLAIPGLRGGWTWRRIVPVAIIAGLLLAAARGGRAVAWLLPVAVGMGVLLMLLRPRRPRPIR